MDQVKNERSPLVEKQEANGHSKSCSSYCARFGYFLSKISVEPVIFLHALSFSIESVFTTNMIIDKTCNLQLNYSKEVCDQLDSGNYEEEENTVQRITSKYQLYDNWIEYGPAIFVMIFLGAWSDTRGRRLPLLLPMIGCTFKALMLIANAYFWHLKTYFIVLSFLPYGLCGSAMSVYMAAYAYVGNDSGNHSRTTRLSLASMVMSAASPLGHALGTVLYMKGGYVFVFGADFIFSYLSVIYVLLRFKAGPPKKRDDEVDKPNEKSKLSLKTVKDSVMVVIKPRDGKQRAHLFAHILCIWITLCTYEGMSFMFLYTRKRFDWDYYKYNIWSIVNTPMSLVASCLILPLLSYYFRLEDTLLGFIGSASHIFFGIIAGTAPYGWVLYIAIAVSAFSGMTITTSRGALSKLVASYELGGVFSVVALGEALTPIIVKPIFTIIYNCTLDTFPGTIFITASAIAVIVCCIYTWILTSDTKKVKIPEP